MQRIQGFLTVLANAIFTKEVATIAIQIIAVISLNLFYESAVTPDSSWPPHPRLIEAGGSEIDVQGED